jgi:hypothetical protein
MGPSSDFVEDDDEQIVRCLKHVRDVFLVFHVGHRDLNGLFLFQALDLTKIQSDNQAMLASQETCITALEAGNAELRSELE